ncbi:protein of unknown function [Magnetospirillum gryphiswaldense MSR-1 v2]|uniref:Uncharacterized protein n=1 Tax=Magnetospirillum gryphiswaldense (strain DSM 6361 / JCM 21280 / NBRC 15271 / MSR-1) TaxID=431944 RepID=V6F683_MAGGM|nr:protein of unknown function [Magnetospirillum gryphiswaldense MSR-1 v2]
MDALIRCMMAAGPPAKRPPHMDEAAAEDADLEVSVMDIPERQE